MSEISDNCTSSIAVADYCAVDGSGKANIIGAGVSYLGFDFQSGVSAPFGLLVTVSSPLPSNRENQASLELVLQDGAGEEVKVAGPSGPTTVRVAQIIEFNMGRIAGTEPPPKNFPVTSMSAFQFYNGLPLVPGMEYKWTVKIDGVEKAAVFVLVPKPSAGPVLG